MVKKFKYDVVCLIQGVRERPCLWDKRLESYKDRMERRMAWEEIFALLDPSYEEMTPEEKRMTGELILNKWTNIRDTFVKTLKPHFGKAKKKYLYHDQLKFLLEVTDISAEDESNVSAEYNIDVTVSRMKQDSESEKDESYNTRKHARKDYTEQNTEDPPRKSKKRKTNQNDCYSLDEKSENGDLDFADTNDGTASEPRLMNEDEAFFASLLPSVVKYSEDEKLEFRIEVLNAMKRIKEKRQWQ